jgi:hypothetical protein
VAIVIAMNIFGKLPKVINVGIVNYESSCELQTLSNDTCLRENLSCHLIQEFRDPLIAILYKSTSEAQKYTKKHDLYMIYTLGKNFSANILDIFDMSSFRGLNELDIELVNDNLLLVQHIVLKFEDIFKSFLTKIATSCNISEKLTRIQQVDLDEYQSENFLIQCIPTFMIL